MKESFTILEHLETPVFWVDEYGVIQWYNSSAAAKIPIIAEESRWAEVCQVLPQGYIYRLHECPIQNRPGLLVESVVDNDPQLLQELDRLRLDHKELETIFHNSPDEVFVTDGLGVTLRVNEAAERLSGFRSEEVVGRSVLELEREGAFYPSVSAMVMREQRRLTILQTTRNGRRLVITGNPVFDEDGRLLRVISNAKDIKEMAFLQEARPTGQQTPTGSRSTGATGTAFVAGSPAMRDMLRLAKRVATTESTVLLLGETGVGKNRIARYIHEHSNRSSGPMVEINCAAIPETLLESELFGYERGAFTGARREGKAGKVQLAEGGTLFLNEIAELPFNLQGKLLDLLQERTITRVGGVRPLTVNIRILTATHRDLEHMVARGLFREDLFYRLHVVPIVIPSLRQRVEDIPALVDVLLERFAAAHNQPRKRMSTAALEVFQTYAWPGNIRQLENALERTVITIDESVIQPHHLPTAMQEQRAVAGPSHLPAWQTDAEDGLHAATDGGLQGRLAELEREIYAEALRRHKTTYAIAAHLQVSQPTVVRKLRRYGLTGA